jgi:hypothetical protein
VDWEPLVGLFAGLIAINQGIAAKRGVWRGFETYYRNPNLPRLARNLAFALVPGGLTLVFMVLAGVSVAFPDARTVTAALFAAVPATFLVAIWFALRPPDAIKPKWILDEEREADQRTARADSFDLIVASVAIVVGVVTALSLAFLLLRS